MLREAALIILILISIPMVFKRPLLAIAIYVGANIIRPEMVFWGGGRGSYVFMVYYALIILASFYKGYLKNAHLIINSRFLLMAWLLIAIWLSILFGQYWVYRSIYFTIELMKVLGICAFIYMVVNEFEDILKIQNIFLGCFAFLGVWGIQQYFLGNERLEGLGGSAWGDSNGVAAVFVMFLPVALAKFQGGKTRKEFWVPACILAIMVSVVIFSQSRGGLLGLIASVAAFSFFSRSMKKIAVISVMVLVVVSPFLSKTYVDRMKTIENVSDTTNSESSARSRLVLWEAGLMVFYDNPLFGTGFMSYPEAKMKYEVNFYDLDREFREWVFRTEWKKVTHNTYIQVMSDCGLFGAIPFFLLITGGIYTGFKARRLLPQFPDKSPEVRLLAGLCAGILGFAVCIVFIDALLVEFLYFQLAFIGILLKVIHNKGDMKPSNTSVPLMCEGTQP